jgi:glycosyltransferase 2 family protein
VTLAWARRLLTYALLAAAFAFLGSAIVGNWDQLSAYDWRVDPALLLLSVVAHVVVLAWGVFILSLVLRHLDSPAVPYARLLRIWSLSSATRYIPGTVWQFMAAAELARAAGLSGVVTLTSMVVHVLFSLIAAVTISAALLPLDAAGLGPFGLAWVRWSVVAAALLAVHPGVINAGLRLIPRALHKDVLVWRGSWGDGVLLLLLANFSWLIYGVAYHLFVASLTAVPASSFFLLVAVNALSFTIGYVAVVAPGGLGVRESAMTALLTGALPRGVAGVVSIAARLWSIVAELLLIVLSLALARGAGRADEPQEEAP